MTGQFITIMDHFKYRDFGAFRSNGNPSGSGKKNQKRKQNQHNRAIADLNVPVLGGEIEVQRGFRKSL